MTDEKPTKTQTGMIPRRVEMPVGMWNDVLELAKSGGLDHRDALLALIDLGLQAQDEGMFKPRLVSVEHELWERVSRAKLKGATEHEALVYLVDLGLQAKAAQDARAPLPEPPPDGTRVRIDLLKEEEGLIERVAERYMDEVPVVGDHLSLGGRHYEVKQRAWALPRDQQTGPTVYLRVTVKA